MKYIMKYIETDGITISEETGKKFPILEQFQNMTIKKPLALNNLNISPQYIIEIALAAKQFFQVTIPNIIDDMPDPIVDFDGGSNCNLSEYLQEIFSIDAQCGMNQFMLHLAYFTGLTSPDVFNEEQKQEEPKSIFISYETFVEQLGMTLYGNFPSDIKGYIEYILIAERNT